jgi:hypothetical protein
MSLQHDVKRYAPTMGMIPCTFGGDYVTYADYEAVRGEVERLTAELKARDKRVAEQRRQLSSLEANYIGTQKVLIGYISKTPARIAEALKDTHVNTVVFMESLNTAITRAETAEASLRSLRDALELVNQRFGVHSGECFTCDHVVRKSGHQADCPIPTIQNALTPAAGNTDWNDATRAARKAK